MLAPPFETAPATPQGKREKDPYQAALTELVEAFRPERALVLQDVGTFRALAWEGFTIPDPSNLIALPLSTSLLYQVLETQQPMACRNLQASMGFHQRWSVMASEIRSLVCVPYWGPEGQVEGLLYVDSRREQDFNETQPARQQALACEIADRLSLRLRGEERPQAHRGQTVSPSPAPAKPRLVAEPLARLRPAAAALPPYLRALSSLLEAGVPLVRGLEVLQHSCEDPQLARITYEVRGLLLKGLSLSRALRQFPRAFPPTLVSMVCVGEATGTLVAMLGAAATFQEKLEASRRRLLSSLAYPALVLALVSLLVLLLPQLLLQGPLQLLHGQSLPLATRLLMGLAQVAARPFFWVALLLALAGGVELARRWLRAPSNRLAVYRRALRLPLVGRVLRLHSAARFCQSLAIMTGAGLPFHESLELAARASQSPLLQARLPACLERLLEEGRSIQASLAALELPGHFLEFVGAGEESGQLPAMLARMGECYQLELEAALELYLTLLEPFAMLVLGAVVAGVLLASLLPMLQVLETL